MTVRNADGMRSMLPLYGIRVVDLSTVLMGPYASQTLADLGAEVIKIETPEGDSTRRTGVATEPGMAVTYLGLNRNKRSIVLDLKDARAREALLRLVDGADVFMHNIRPQKLAAIGIAPEALLPRNPRLVYAGLHGFGQDGPYGGSPAYDDIIQGMCGLVAVSETQFGEPRYLPTVIADKVSGLIAANAILAALMRRHRTGLGGFVEIPMFEAMVGFTMVEHLYGETFIPARAPAGYPRTLSAWRRPYRTLDGHVSLMPYTDRHWRDFFLEAGEPDLAADPRFGNIDSRTRHVGPLYEATGRIVAGRTTADWLEACARLQIPAAPILRIEDLVADPHLLATGFFTEHEDPSMGRVRQPGVAVRFDGQRPPVAVPPRLGEHTEGVLREAGLTEAEIAALAEPRATETTS